MEEWLSETRDPNGEAMAAQFTDNGTNDMKLTVFIGTMSEHAASLEGRTAYATLFVTIRHLYYGAPGARTAAMARCMYTLEQGETLPLEPGLPREDEAHRLAALDARRAEFKQQLIDAFATMTKYADRNYVIGWARLMYSHVHGFQAPPRTDRALAIRDAMGQTDHFVELMEEVIAESPEAVE